MYSDDIFEGWLSVPLIRGFCGHQPQSPLSPLNSPDLELQMEKNMRDPTELSEELEQDYQSDGSYPLDSGCRPSSLPSPS